MNGEYNNENEYENKEKFNDNIENDINDLQVQELHLRLYQMKQEEKERELSETKKNQSSINFGSQIRSYVMHPYSLVKDHRTNYETSNVLKVLDGDIDEFIESYLNMKE